MEFQRIRSAVRELQSYPPETWDMLFLAITVPIAILVILGMR